MNKEQKDELEEFIEELRRNKENEERIIESYKRNVQMLDFIIGELDNILAIAKEEGECG